MCPIITSLVYILVNTPSKIKSHIEQVEKHINNYFQQLEQSYSQENSPNNITNIESKLDFL
ncbi:MAG: hypothetical protein ACI9F1_001533, partial [Colwellia sp.]